jgi:hypothetical protein
MECWRDGWPESRASLSGGVGDFYQMAVIANEREGSRISGETLGLGKNH